jgi:hypothetical protein
MEEVLEIWWLMNYREFYVASTETCLQISYEASFSLEILTLLTSEQRKAKR